MGAVETKYKNTILLKLTFYQLTMIVKKTTTTTTTKKKKKIQTSLNSSKCTGNVTLFQFM